MNVLLYSDTQDNNDFLQESRCFVSPSDSSFCLDLSFSLLSTHVMQRDRDLAKVNKGPLVETRLTQTIDSLPNQSLLALQIGTGLAEAPIPEEMLLVCICLCAACVCG